MSRMKRAEKRTDLRVVIRMRKKIKDVQTELAEYRKLYYDEFIEACKERRRREIMALDAGFHSGCREYLLWNVLSAKNMDEFEQKREEYLKFQDRRYKKLQEEITPLTELVIGQKKYFV